MDHPFADIRIGLIFLVRILDDLKILPLTAFLVFFSFISISASDEFTETKSSTVSLGTIQESRSIEILNQTYIDQYLEWSFLEIDNNTWTGNFSINEDLWNAVINCRSLPPPQRLACWNNLKNTYFPDFNLTQLIADFLNMTNYPLRNLTKDISFSNFRINLTSGTGSFTINFPNGFKDGENAELGFGSTIIGTSTSTNIFSSGGKSICRTTNRIHVTYPSSTARYTNSTDGITWGTSIQLDGARGSDNPNANVFVECSGNNVFVSWLANHGGHSYMNSSDEGATWTSNTTGATGDMAPRLTGMPYTSSSTPISSSMLLPNTNNIFLASWNHSEVGVIVLNTSTYSGEADPTNTTTTIFLPATSNKHHLAIYINSSGTIFVAIKSGTDNDLYFNFSSDEGSTWTGKKVSGFVTYNYPDIVQMNGTIFIVTYDNSDDIKLHNSSDDGATWSSAIRIDTIGAGTSKAQYPSLATDGANLYVFWQENDTVNDRNWDIRYRKWNVSSGWDDVVYWQNFTNGAVDGSTFEPRPSAKRGNSSNLIEVIWANRTATSGSISIMYDFINLTVVSEGADETLPKWQSNQTNSTVAGTLVNHSILLSDDTALDYYTFEFDNGTNVLSNISTVDISGTSYTANQTITINYTSGSLIRWRYYFNDTTNNWNSTFLFNYTSTANITIAFISPTPANSSNITDNWIYVNTSINSTFNTSSYIDFNKSLVGYLSMDWYNATGVFDNSSYNNFGVFKNMSSGNITAGKYGKGLNFNSSNQSYVDAGNNSNFNFGTGNFTIELWFKTNGTPSGGEAIGKADAGWVNYWYIQVDSSGITVEIWDDVEDGTVSNNTKNYLDNSWHHIAVTKNGTTVSLYADSNLSNTNTFTGSLNSIGPFYVGGHPYDMAYFFNGTIDEVRLWSRALSPEEINASYNSKDYRLFRNFTSLSNANYTFNAYTIESYGGYNTTNNYVVGVNAAGIQSYSNFSTMGISMSPATAKLSSFDRKKENLFSALLSPLKLQLASRNLPSSITATANTIKTSIYSRASSIMQDISDAVARLFNSRPSFTLQPSINNIKSTLYIFSRDMKNTFLLSNIQTRTLNIYRNFIGEMALTPTKAVNYIYSRAISLPQSISSSFIRQSGVLKEIVQQLSLSSATSRLLSAAKSLTTSLNLNAVAERLSILSRSFASQFTAGSSSTLSRVYSRSASIFFSISTAVANVFKEFVEEALIPTGSVTAAISIWSSAVETEVRKTLIGLAASISLILSILVLAVYQKRKAFKKNRIS